MRREICVRMRVRKSVQQGVACAPSIRKFVIKTQNGFVEAHSAVLHIYPRRYVQVFLTHDVLARTHFFANTLASITYCRCVRQRQLFVHVHARKTSYFGLLTGDFRVLSTTSTDRAPPTRANRRVKP